MESAKIQDGKDEVPQEELRNTRDAYLLGECRPELFQNEILADIFEHTANSLPHKVAMVFLKCEAEWNKWTIFCAQD